MEAAGPGPYELSGAETEAETSVRSRTLRRQIYHPWQVDYMGPFYMGRSGGLPSLELTPTLDVGLSSLPDPPLPTPFLKAGWGTADLLTQDPMLCCLRPRSHIWAKRCESGLMTMGPTNYHIPLHLKQ